MKPTREIPLSQGYVAIVDAGDYERVMAGPKWSAQVNRRTVYAFRTVRRDDGVRTSQYLHAFLTGSPRTDHRNGNGLDNQRANLRTATNSENGMNRRLGKNNTSGFKGVSWHKRYRSWQAAIMLDGTRRHLGSFATPEEAACAYDAAAREHFGQFARLNFPE